MSLQHVAHLFDHLSARTLLDPRCVAGSAGSAGPPGAKGQDGREGLPGTRPQIVTVPTRDVFGTRIPPSLAELINYRPASPARR